MSELPAKRRKTSPSTAAPVDATAAGDVSANSHLLQSPVTHRQSFQSPTRASLARSNPEVLAHVLSRSPTRSPQRQPVSRSSRGNPERPLGLRDRKALRPSLTNEMSSPPRQTIQSPRRGPLAAQAFAAPPRRVSRRLETPTQGGDIGSGGAPTTPLNNFMRGSDPDEQLASELNSATRELENSGLLAPSVLPDDSLEPELPPTPTQLGRKRMPGKDLSGPRTLHAAETTLRSEPEPEEPDVQKRKNVKRELLAQLDQLKTDVAELEKWTDRAKRSLDKPQPDPEAVASLMSTDRQSNSPILEHPPISTLISSLLPFSAKAVPVQARPTSPEPINTFALNNIHDPKPYITAFASLSLEHSQSLSLSTSSEGAITETHEIILSAPFPFPQNQFRIPLVFTIELQSQRITSVSLQKDHHASQAKIPSSLQAWIKSRISSPILALDISGLCVGISRYWEASVCRAKIWSRLKKSQEILLAKKGQRKLSDIRAEQHLTGPLKKSDLRSIVPHLQRSSMLFSPSSSISRSTSNSSGSRRESKLLLSCPLRLDQWTSEAQLQPDISISIPDLSESKRKRVELDMKRLFHNVLREQGKLRKESSTGMNEEREAQAIVNAAEGVMGVLFGLDIL
ncbi:hypothetical protein UA08_02711 [Talaromyces atroroseus]|uniref:Uncharacterized protein n=1 Tax=Talaromyces atroroseus TaxID=1441469 RepID=A0A225AVU1_TALAT|nr:hypothetical protein UA08_02711 [Talaromyces atroroseus]OKL62484.1 hypothetical protein UA08_02711 [Talaromyces atroroseus]